MKMSSLTKSLPIDHLLTIFLSLIPLLQIKVLAFDTKTSLSLSNTINVASNETDFHALLAIKSNIFSEYQQALSSWNESLHFCLWEGVECSHRHKRVTVLNLTSRGLTGTLSPSIGNLSFLREIGLYNNTFIDEIPTELGNLFRLQVLRLSRNLFEGKFPTSLYRCSNLMVLELDGNKLVGEFPKELGYSMPTLERLIIRDNNLTGGVPPSIGNITSLVRFSATGNPLGGTIPNALGKLKNLKYFGLSVAQLSGTIPSSLYNLSLLVWLSLADNRLSGSLPSSFGFMFPHLVTLQLDHNQFNGPLPFSISNCSHMEQLELNTNNFNGKITIDFGGLQKLRIFHIYENNFGTRGSDGLAFLNSLTNCSELVWTYMDNCHFTGELPDVVGNLSKSLTDFALDGNQLYGSIPSTIGNLVNLEILSLSNNLFTGSIPDSLGYLHKIQWLSFANNNLSGEIPESIGNLSLLIKLYLGKNRLEGAIPASLGNCRNLLYLTLSKNNLNGIIPKQLLMVSSLSILLDLSRNHLSGSLPHEVGNLKNLFEIDISQNDLSGEIPNTLGSCSSLENLYLQRNFFQGSIPSSMESLRGIQNLDLSHNNLSGHIPIFLGTFALENLILSFNNFEGELPMKGVFTNASGISVAGNYRLCGGISELQLPPCTTKKARNKMSLSQKLGITVASVLIGVTVVSYFVIGLFKKKRKTKPPVSLLKDSILKVTYGELLKATKGFSSTNLLGFGSFGHVYKGIIDQNGELLVAVKVLDLQTRGATKSFMAECEALRTIRHRNVVSVITCCSSVDYQGNEFKALVYEFMPNGSLDNWLHSIPTENNGQREFVGLDLIQRIDIAIDVACALDYLHHQCGRPIIHCDLKPSNVLLDSDMVAHVGDFGLARFREEFTTPSTSSSTAIRGTIGYAAPEYGLGCEMSTSGDVYSYGNLLLEMITWKRPTDKTFEADLNLHNFVKIAFPERALEIVDPMLLTEENHGRKMVEYLIPVLKIGLACSAESPVNRMSINTALHELHWVKKDILKIWVHGNSFESFLIAVVNPNKQALKRWAEENGITGDFNSLCENPITKGYILGELTRIGKEMKLKGFEFIKAVHLDPMPSDMDLDLLTPTLKKKRPQLLKYYEAFSKKSY